MAKLKQITQQTCEELRGLGYKYLSVINQSVIAEENIFVITLKPHCEKPENPLTTLENDDVRSLLCGTSVIYFVMYSNEQNKQSLQDR